MEAFFIKINDALYPASNHDRELLTHIKQGDPTRLVFKRVRNYEFHKKYMALLNFAFDNWVPNIQELTPIHVEAEKNFDEFRKNIAILAGWRTTVIDLHGNPHYRAKSISFGKMDDIEFSELFSKTIDVIIKNVEGMTGYSGAQLRAVIEQVEAFE